MFPSKYLYYPPARYTRLEGPPTPSRASSRLVGISPSKDKIDSLPLLCLVVVAGAPFWLALSLSLGSEVGLDVGSFRWRWCLRLFDNIIFRYIYSFCSSWVVYCGFSSCLLRLGHFSSSSGTAPWKRCRVKCVVYLGRKSCLRLATLTISPSGSVFISSAHYTWPACFGDISSMNL